MRVEYRTIKLSKRWEGSGVVFSPGEVLIVSDEHPGQLSGVFHFGTWNIPKDVCEIVQEKKYPIYIAFD